MLIDDVLETAIKGDLRYIHSDHQQSSQLAMDAMLTGITRAKAFDFSDVVLAYESHRDAKTFMFRRDVFCALPPYPLTWVEAPREGSKQGCLVASEHSTEPRHVPSSILLTNRRPEPAVKEVVYVANDGSTTELNDVFMVSVSPVIKVKTSILAFPMLMYCVTDKQGRPLTHPFSYPSRFEHLSEDLQGIIKETMPRIGIFWFGFSLLACRNISTEIRHPDPRLQKARAKRGKAPLRNFYVLNVTVNRTSPSPSVRAPGEQPIQRRLHEVRGHMANYTQGAGLFGKYHGYYWIPDHHRGTPEQGTIVKDYKVHIAP